MSNMMSSTMRDRRSFELSTCLSVPQRSFSLALA